MRAHQSCDFTGHELAVAALRIDDRPHVFMQRADAHRAFAVTLMPGLEEKCRVLPVLIRRLDLSDPGHGIGTGVRPWGWTD